MILALATLWLAWADMLTFFIHPRYVFFTAEMAILALVASVWVAWRGITPEEHDEHAHPHTHQPPTISDGHTQRKTLRVPAWFTGAASLLLVGCVAGMVLIVPPAPLSATLASERALAGGGVGERSTGQAVITSLAQMPDEATVGDWAQLLANAPTEEVRGQHPTVDGFIIAPDEIADHGYYLVRFQIACCAVDALPVGIPIADPQWREKYAEGQWLRVNGEFTANSGLSFPEESVLTPRTADMIDEPEQPYLF